MLSLLVILALLSVTFTPALASDAHQSQTYAVNANGETYGNNLQAIALGYEADLIAAVGQFGIEGYVRKSELYDDGVTCPDDAKNAPSVYYIPLYKSDGTTVIGRFKVGGVESETQDRSNSYAYGNYSGIYYSDFTGQARSGIGSASGRVVGITAIEDLTTARPDGYFGVNVEIYDQETGKLVSSSGFHYYSSASGQLTQYYSYTHSYRVSDTSKAFYCNGAVRVWRGTYYDTHGTFVSLAQNPGQ